MNVKFGNIFYRNQKKFTPGVILIVLILILASSCKKEQAVIDSNNAEIQSSDPVITQITEAIKSRPGDHSLYYERAGFLYERENYELAIVDLNKAISIDSSQADYYHLLSDVFLDYYKSGEALNIMENVVKRFPERIPSLLKLGELQLILKQYDASFFTVQKILNLDNQNAEAFFLMGMLFRAQDDKERAINSFQSAVEIDPEIVDAWIILGDLFAERDNNIAERYYDNAINLDPENMQTYHAKAYYLQNNQRTNEAIRLYKIINSKDPQYSDAYLNTGVLYLEMDSLEQAYEHFNILVKISPEDHLGYYYRGITLLFGGNEEAAKADLEQCLVFNPAFEKARIALEEVNISQ